MMMMIISISLSIEGLQFSFGDRFMASKFGEHMEQAADRELGLGEC